MSDAIRKKVLAHEIGHAFGLGHQTDSTSIMKQGVDVVLPNEDDIKGMKVMTHHMYHTDAYIERISVSDTQHFVRCTKCNKGTTYEAHTYTEFNNNNNGTHTLTCKCDRTGATVSCIYGDYYYTDTGTVHYRDCSYCGYIESSTHTYGAWVNTSSTQHTKTCSACGKTVTGSHGSYGSWTYYNASSHRRKCGSCAYYQYADHPYSAWSYYSSTQHKRTCPTCNGTIKANHTFQYSGGYLVCTACGYEKPYELLDEED